MNNIDEFVKSLYEGGVSYQEIAQYINRQDENANFDRHKVYRSLCRSGVLGKEPKKPKTDTQRLIEEKGLNPSEWNVLSVRDSKISFKPKVKSDIIWFEEIKNNYANFEGVKLENYTYPKENSQRMEEFNIADFHLGKLCWKAETGKNFDVKLAKTMFYKILANAVQYLSDREPEKILFVWANDFFNSDTEDAKTTRGTQQDTDGRHPRMFNVGCDLLIDAINELRKIAPVETFYTPSNHDKMTGYCALRVICEYFRDCDNVTINDSYFPRKYVKYGNCLVGFSHGDCEKGSGIFPQLMASEVPQDWGDTLFREFHVHHMHSEHAIREFNGLIVRRISSPTPPDNWHTMSGFNKSLRKTQVFTWDKKKGLTDIHNIYVE